MPTVRQHRNFSYIFDFDRGQIIERSFENSSQLHEYDLHGLKKALGNNVRLEDLPVAATFVKIDFLRGWP
ncbi:hypothetical protein BDFB_004957 [Asbolus verrucosus]|uniref:Uncharacterized protein n=1 Tax=Asbolus verrucosus TaxID=1661398 RepID=A0A482VAP1_ASBVE|nr:hypothetical protein BDFB_004957 [Asbolus verrucosus]